MTSTPSRPRKNTGRPALPIGVSGVPWTTKRDNGRWTAGAWIRGTNGRKRQVTASGTSKGAALRNLQRKVDALVEPAAQGMQPTWTIAQGARHWRTRLENVGGGVTRRPLKPQTLAAYDSEIRRIVEPTLGDIRLNEVTIALIEAALTDLEQNGLSTAGARDVLSGLFRLAVRDSAMRENPMPYVAVPAREPKEVEVLTIEAAHLLLEVVHRDYRRTRGRRRPNRDLHDVVALLLGSGMRVGEVLALRHQDVDIDSQPATVTVSGTMVEPIKKPKFEWADSEVPDYVAEYHRQPTTKTNQVRTLVLPEVVAEQLRERRQESRFVEPHHPLLASGTGQHLWAANIRTRLRSKIADEPTLVGTTPHTLRRTVASLVAYEYGLDAARRQLGHVVVTGALAHYVGHRREVPDYTAVLDQLFPNTSHPQEGT